jgi:hypothetical protein
MDGFGDGKMEQERGFRAQAGHCMPQQTTTVYYNSTHEW